MPISLKHINTLDSDNIKLDNVNYNYYIEKANRIITKIKTEGKRIKTVYVPNQLNLFE